MKLQLHRLPAGSVGPDADVPIAAVKAQAWTDGKGNVYVIRPYDRKLYPRRRIAHEVWHNLDDDDDHHPWWHFCTAVGHGLRLRDAHVAPACFKVADELLRVGRVDTSTAAC